MARSRNTADTQTASGGPVSPFIAGKNKLINGDFSINQGNFSSTTTSSTYGHDRWQIETTGGTTYSTQAFTPGSAPVAGYEAKNYARIVTVSQNATSALADFNQRIEDVRTLAGQTATLSFWAKASSGTPKIGLAFSQEFGTGGSSGSPATIADKTISTTWTRYSATFNVPSVSGKTIGTGSFLLIYLFTSAGTDFSLYTPMGAQNATIDIWGVQLEAGSVATPFQTATGTIQGELAACQRYYWRLTPGQNESVYGISIATSTSGASVAVNNPVPMRVIPTSVDFSTLALLLPAVAFYPASGLTIATNGSSQNVVTVTLSASGLTSGRWYFLTNNGTNVGYLGFSAEL